MGVYIPGMEMPTCCDDCHFAFQDVDDVMVCGMNNKVIGEEIDLLNERPSFCPLIEIPPHGRLIDADDLENVTVHLDNDLRLKSIFGPIIIPAEEG